MWLSRLLQDSVLLSRASGFRVGRIRVASYGREAEAQDRGGNRPAEAIALLNISDGPWPPGPYGNKGL